MKNKNLSVTKIGQDNNNWEVLDPDNPYAVEMSQSQVSETLGESQMEGYNTQMLPTIDEEEQKPS